MNVVTYQAFPRTELDGATTTQTVSTKYYPTKTSDVGIDLMSLMASGRPTLFLSHPGNGGGGTTDVTLEASVDGTNWATSDTFTQVTSSASQQIKMATTLAKFYRVKVVQGTATSAAFKLYFQFDGDPNVYVV